MYVRMYVTRNGNTVSKLAVIVADKFGLSEVILIWKKNNNKQTKQQPWKIGRLRKVQICLQQKAGKGKQNKTFIWQITLTILLGREQIISKLVICLRNRE